MSHTEQFFIFVRSFKLQNHNWRPMKGMVRHDRLPLAQEVDPIHHGLPTAAKVRPGKARWGCGAHLHSSVQPTPQIVVRA